jgi:hypothetical protein
MKPASLYSRRKFIKLTAAGFGSLAGSILLSSCRIFGGIPEWKKYAQNPVFGPEVGTVFDVSLLKENDRYRMWFSWRDQESIGLTESPDGIHWEDPVVVFEPSPISGWETKVNRPYVLKQGDEYFLWYTGQTASNSCLGDARSLDGIHWMDRSASPVLTPEKTWE